jgi:hypothetical protein
MRTTPILLSLGLCFVVCPSATCDAEAESRPSNLAEKATGFLRHLENDEVDAAMKLWARNAVNERLRKRVEQISAKIRALGGIKAMKTPDVEKRPRNLQSHEVVVAVIFRNRNLAFGSFSFAGENGELKISSLRSEQGWGGTTSLFADEPDRDSAGTAVEK